MMHFSKCRKQAVILTDTFQNLVKPAMVETRVHVYMAAYGNYLRMSTLQDLLWIPDSVKTFGIITRAILVLLFKELKETMLVLDTSPHASFRFG